MIQTVYNGALAGGEMGRICRRLRRWILRTSDPVVAWQLNGRQLRLPFSHQLPFYRREFPTYSANLERLAAVLRQDSGALTMIDVGANIGDSLALARIGGNDACLLIEGDPSFFALLQRNTADLPQATCVAAMLSDQAGEIDGVLVSTDGTAQVVRAGSRANRVALTTLDDLLKDHPRFQSAQLLKVDVDGYDLKVLRGSQELIHRAQPVLFFEQYPALLAAAGENPNSAWTWLAKAGYDRVFLYDNLGYWLGSFPLGDERTLAQLNAYARQRSNCYYDVAAFAPRHGRAQAAFAAGEEQFYRQLSGSANEG